MSIQTKRVRTKSSQQRAVTQSTMKAVTNLVETQCSEASCGMTILVDREDLASGRKERCVACLMRAKMGAGIK
jgi:hypothetical protein